MLAKYLQKVRFNIIHVPNHASIEAVDIQVCTKKKSGKVTSGLDIHVCFLALNFQKYMYPYVSQFVFEIKSKHGNF